MTTMSNPVEAPFLTLLIANLQQAVSDAQRRKAEENTDINLPPRYAVHAKAKRQEIVEWLVQNGPATAAEVAARFSYHPTTAHSYLNRIVHDGQAKIINRRCLRVFVAEESKR